MIQLSQSKLSTWRTCERKFQLSYVEHSEWPVEPMAHQATEALEMGATFHMLVAQRILLGDQFEMVSLPLEAPLKDWWEAFLAKGPVAKMSSTAATYRVESALSTQINSEIKLFGRIDLLIAAKNSIEIFDWKTGRPRTKADLEQDWQTRIYMALLYKSCQTICGEKIAADQISMTYWYVRQPEKSVRISCTDEWHAKNWEEIRTFAEQITSRIHSGCLIWPLTADLAECGRCTFNAICGREPATDKFVPDLQNEINEDEISEGRPAEFDIHPDI